MTHSSLPPALAPWSASLAFLTVEAALHIGPLVRRIDSVVRRHDAVASAQGDPDGYGGLSTRGGPEQMVLSEWLLAEELPMEFLQRAANRELLYVAPVARSPQPRGRVAVIFDVGEQQLGACRLVQLAALIVLHRRAAARGSELAIATTGDPPDVWHVGDMPELFVAWREGRHAPANDQRQRLERLDAADELWVLCGEASTKVWPHDALVMRIAETEWNADGVTTAEIRFEGRRTSLALPEGPVAVATLRGAAMRRRPARQLTAGAGSFGAPLFPSADRRLIARGDTPDELVALTIPTHASGSGRPRTHRFPGAVLAAAPLGRRLAALVHVDDHVELRVVGKSFSRLEGLRVPTVELPDEALGAGALEPLYYESGNLLCRLAGTWWHLVPDRAPAPDASIVGVGPGAQLDLPHVVVLGSDGVLRDRFSWRELAAGVDRDRLAVVVSQRSVAWSTGDEWHVRRHWHRHPGRAIQLDVPRDETVLGVTAAGALITRSEAGMLIRLRTETEVRTLTSISGIARAHAVHPAADIVAILREPELIEVREIESGALLVRVASG
jgi:hypothetical protein